MADRPTNPDSADRNQWRIPPAWNSEGKANTDAVLRWVNTSLDLGIAYLNTQSSASDIDDAINIIKGNRQQLRPVPLSNIQFPKAKQFITEELGMLANIRPMTDYRSDITAPIYQSTALQLNGLYKSWYLRQHIDGKIYDALQWASMAKGYIELVWEPADDFDADGEGEIEAHVHGPRDVYIVQPSADHDLQKAQCVIIRKPYALDAARTKWHEFADQIQPDRTLPSATSMLGGLWGRMRTFFADHFMSGSRTEDEPNPFPVVDVYYCYVRDASTNPTTHDILMAPGKIWGYNVPPLVDPDGKPHEVWTGLYALDSNGNPVFDADGNPQRVMRPVSKKEAMLYPNRRLIICTKTLVFYDGPSYWWHGKVPLTPFNLSKWVFQDLGFSLYRDGKTLGDSIESDLRNQDDSDACRLRPPLVADQSKVPEEFLNEAQINTRRAGDIVPLPTAEAVESGLKPLLSVEYYDVPAGHREHTQWKVDQLRELLLLPGVKDLMSAKQIPSGDSIEKLAELAGPGINRLSRNMEKSLQEIGEQFKWLAGQFYTTAKKYEVLGPDGVSMVDFDYDPGNMIPDMLDEHPELAGPDNRYRRARLHLRRLTFRVVPNSMHNMTQYSRKLLYLMLMKQGFPIDPWTVAEAFDMVNFGPMPPGTKTIMDRWMLWNDLQLELKGLLAAKAKEMGLMNDDGRAGGKGVVGPGQGKSGGRPPSFGTAPHLAQKDGASRSTIATS